jgi:hypothetical protein
LQKLKKTGRDDARTEAACSLAFPEAHTSDVFPVGQPFAESNGHRLPKQDGNNR